MSGEDYKFEGWMGLGPESADGKMVWQEFPKDRKPFEETDVDIQITHSGICGSDLHTLRSGWGPTPYVCWIHALHLSRTHANTSYLDSPSASVMKSSAKLSRLAAKPRKASRLATQLVLERSPTPA
jgi:hypothetical protein